MAGDREPVLVVEREHLVVEAVGGLEVRHPQDLAAKLESVAQDVKRPFDLELLDQRADDEGVQPVAVQLTHGVPLGGLGCFEEGADVAGEQSALHIPATGVAGFRAAL